MISYIKKYGPLAILMVAYTTMWIDKSLISMAVIPISHIFSFSKTEIGVIISSYSLGYALISFPGGVLSDIFGYKKVIFGCMLLAALACVIFPFCSVLILFILIRFLLGISHGSIPSSSAKAIALNYEKEKRMMVQSVWFMAGSLGGLIAAWIGSRMMAVDWRYSYYAVAVCYVIAGILIAVGLKDIKTAEVEQKEKVKEQSKHKLKFIELLFDRNILVLAVSVFAFNLVLNGSIWFPSFLKQKFNLTLIDIGYIQGVISFIGVITPLVCGFLCSRLFNNREHVFVFLSAVVSSVCYLIYVLSGSITVIIICYAVSMLTSMFTFIAIKNLPHKIIKEKYIGTSMGLITAISSLGGFVAPMLLGLLIDISGDTFDYAYYTLAGVMLFGGFVCLLGVKTSKNNSEASI